jgi:hypothetical protein
MPRRTTGRSRTKNLVNSNILLKRTRNCTRTPPSRAPRRNMQKPHPNALVRRMVRVPTGIRRSAQRNGTQRLPLRPHSSSPCTSRPSQGWIADQRRTTTTLPIHPKTTSLKLTTKHFTEVFAVHSTSPQTRGLSW